MTQSELLSHVKADQMLIVLIRSDAGFNQSGAGINQSSSGINQQATEVASFKYELIKPLSFDYSISMYRHHNPHAIVLCAVTTSSKQAPIDAAMMRAKMNASAYGWFESTSMEAIGALKKCGDIIDLSY